MRDLDVFVTDDITVDEAAVIENGLSQFNDAFVGYADRQPLAVLVPVSYTHLTLPTT